MRDAPPILSLISPPLLAPSTVTFWTDTSKTSQPPSVSPSRPTPPAPSPSRPGAALLSIPQPHVTPPPPPVIQQGSPGPRRSRGRCSTLLNITEAARPPPQRLRSPEVAHAPIFRRPPPPPPFRSPTTPARRLRGRRCSSRRRAQQVGCSSTPPPTQGAHARFDARASAAHRLLAPPAPQEHRNGVYAPPPRADTSQPSSVDDNSGVDAVVIRPIHPPDSIPTTRMYAPHASPSLALPRWTRRMHLWPPHCSHTHPVPLFPCLTHTQSPTTQHGLSR